MSRFQRPSLLEHTGGEGCSRRTSGFTFLQLIICLAVLGVLLSLALPALHGAVAETHSSSVRTALYDSVVAGGNHATITSTETVVCASSDGQRCSGSKDWSGGWIVFGDRDGNRERGQQETLVRKQQALEHDTRLRSTSGRTRLVFQPLGSNAGSNATFTLCDKRGAGQATSVVLANSGRIRQGRPGTHAASECAYSR